MQNLTRIVCFALLLGASAAARAQDGGDDAPLPVIPGRPPSAPAPKSYTGFAWGAMHTIWNGRWSNEGYPDAGTLGPVVSLRKVSAVGSRMAMVPYISYAVMRSRVTVPCDTCADGDALIRTYFREIDLGVHLHAMPFADAREWYIGGGPSFRWGQAGKRIDQERRPGSIRKAAWFGVTVLAGYRHSWGAKRAVFFEPQFTFSPDMADRWQGNYPPETLSMTMGLLW